MYSYTNEGSISLPCWRHRGDTLMSLILPFLSGYQLVASHTFLHLQGMTPTRIRNSWLLKMKNHQFLEKHKPRKSSLC